MKRSKTSESKKQSKPERSTALVLVPAPEAEVPAPIADPPPTLQPYQSNLTCPDHPEIKFRRGGFCERCYSEKAVERMAEIDNVLERKVLSSLDDLVEKVVSSNDPVLLERFIGRILSRFSRPQEHKVQSQLTALHLIAGVDFGSGRKQK